MYQVTVETYNKKSKEMIALADKCIICSGYEKFKIVGKTQTKIYGSSK